MLKTSHLLTDATTATPTDSAIIKTTRPRKSFHASSQTTNGSGTATVTVSGSNDGGLSWIVLASLSLTAATTLAGGVHAGYATDAAYETFKMSVTAISGTGCKVNCWAAN